MKFRIITNYPVFRAALQMPLSGVNGLVAIYRWTNNEGKMYYIHQDHLGSFDVVTDQEARVVERYSFDAWGNRRDPNNWSQVDSRSSWLFARGFTGHEHLDRFGIINMNGRVYDPKLGRFLSPDIFVNDPSFTQSYNRYTYCLNNPLILVDPSGYDDEYREDDREDDGPDRCPGWGDGGGALDHFCDNVDEWFINEFINSDSFDDLTPDEQKDIGEVNEDSFEDGITEGYDNTREPELIPQEEQPESYHDRFYGNPRDKKDNTRPKQPLISITFNRGIPQIETKFIDSDWGAVTPGPFIIYPNEGVNNRVYTTHEPGHVIQYLILGPIGYFNLIALPSAASSLTPFHKKMPWEKSANQLWYWLTGEHHEPNPLFFGPKKK
jgi:RHS repeat-associated protein